MTGRTSRGGTIPILIATRSSGKLREIRQLLEDLRLECLSLTDVGIAPAPEEEGIERFETFEENARAKAEYFFRRSGMPTLADDSGLCVDALGGEPGVRTKRFAPEELARRLGRDEANNRYLLERLAGVPEEERGAEYRCAAAAVEAGGASVVRLGRVRGRIATEPRGTGGFGYDPLFFFPPGGGTFAELPPEVKARHSHRARAVRALRPWLLEHLVREVP